MNNSWATNYLPRELEEQISVFFKNYNNKRLHESLNNFMSADVYFGRGQAILEKKGKDQKTHHPKPTLTASAESRIT